MVSLPYRSPDATFLPLGNDVVAERLEEIAQLLESKDSNPHRVRAYRNAARTVRGLEQPIAELLNAEGVAALHELPGIGESLARTIARLVATGDEPLLARLRGRSGDEALLATVPGVGPKMAARIHDELGIETLEELERAAYDGRLAELPGIGRKRLLAVRESLGGRFGRHPRAIPRDYAQALWQPPIAELLSIDDEYRRKAAADRLLKVSPIRFNPTGKAWLPILRTRREGRRYTALFSNTPQAHQLGMTGDWVVIFRVGPGDRGQWTVVTSRHGTTNGRRVVRGREAECELHYARVREDIAASLF